MLRQINGLEVTFLCRISARWKIYQDRRGCGGIALAVPDHGPYVLGNVKGALLPPPGAKYDGDRCPRKPPAAG
jgi:hypothetical protein